MAPKGSEAMHLVFNFQNKTSLSQLIWLTDYIKREFVYVCVCVENMLRT